jgi:transposase
VAPVGPRKPAERSRDRDTSGRPARRSRRRLKKPRRSGRRGFAAGRAAIIRPGGANEGGEGPEGRAARHPGAVIETFATDEHRIGLKPILRRVWAPRGERPVAVGHHRFEWLYVTAFVSPATGESFWYLSTGVSKQDFEDILALFAREAGAGSDRIILLVLDNAGWHSPPGLAVPDGIRLVFLPPYSPELQPAETLWVHVDEPIVNQHFDSLADLDAAVAHQCIALNADRDRIRRQAGFRWWPARITPN